jgi:HlyD family secretion protein
MNLKGYASKAQCITERQALDKVRHDLRKVESEFRLFRDFQAPKEILTLRGQIETAEHNLSVETMRCKAQEDRLALTRKQIENCRVLAPHDGIAVRANKRGWWATPLDQGVRVYEGQKLFRIPDLRLLEVEVSVHETMGHRVQVGMRAHVRIASIADREFSGRVASIIPVPIANWREWDESLRHYLARVRLDDTPPSVLPMMSAAVEIDTGRVQGALAIPVESMAIVDGLKSCYVRVPDGVARRTIVTGVATHSLLEVTRGLSEGEQVLSRFGCVDALSLSNGFVRLHME